ncbi:MAG TPA: DMT family transporter [Terriglobales bacterium]|nr:DMT family transporter [Terriglobales bacterium]
MSRLHKAHVLLVLVTVVWGASFVLVKAALSDSTPLLLNALRMGLAAVVLAIYYRREWARLTVPVVRAGIPVGVFLFLGYALQTWGLTDTTPAKSAFLTGVSVVLVPVFMALFWRRLVKRWTAVGVALAFVGLYLLTVPLGALRDGIRFGDLLTLGCAVAFAFQIIYLGRATHRHRFEPIALLQLAVASVLMALAVPLLETPSVTWSSRVLWAIVVTGLASTAAAFSIQAWAQQFTPPTHTALIFSLEPVFAGLISFFFLGERLGGRGLLGAGLILAGVLLSELKGGAVEPAAPPGTPAEQAELEEA